MYWLSPGVCLVADEEGSLKAQGAKLSEKEPWGESLSMCDMDNVMCTSHISLTPCDCCCCRHWVCSSLSKYPLSILMSIVLRNGQHATCQPHKIHKIISSDSANATVEGHSVNVYRLMFKLIIFSGPPLMLGICRWFLAGKASQPCSRQCSWDLQWSATAWSFRWCLGR